MSHVITYEVVARSVFVTQTDVTLPLLKRYEDTMMVSVPKAGTWSVQIHAVTTERPMYILHLACVRSASTFSLVTLDGHHDMWTIEDMTMAADPVWRLMPTTDSLLIARVSCAPIAQTEH